MICSTNRTAIGVNAKAKEFGLKGWYDDCMRGSSGKMRKHYGAPRNKKFTLRSHRTGR